MRPIATMICLGALALAGCDGNAPTAPAASRPAARRADAPVPTRVTLRTIATLTPGRPAQLAPAAGGAVYALQAAEAGGGATVARVDAKGGATLAADAVVRALNLTGRATGQVVAIAARDDGKLAFAFVGDAQIGDAAAAGRIAAIGTWDPKANIVLVTVDQADLARADTRFAEEVNATRPTLLVDGDSAQLWRAGERGLRLLLIGGLSTFRPTLDARTIDVGDAGTRVERIAWEWTHGEPGTTLLTDTASRWIRKVDLATGRAAHVARFEEGAAGTTAIAPATLDAAGRVMTLSIDREGVARSLLVQDGPAFAAVDATRWQLDGVAAPPLRIDRLTPIPDAPGTYVAHDVASGRVFRVTAE